MVSLHLHILLALVPVLLLHFLAGWRVAPATGERQVLTGLARIGYGLAKGLLLVLPLEGLMQLFLHAAPPALNAKMHWLAAVVFTFQLYLAMSAVADLIIGLGLLRRRVLPENGNAPLRAGGFTDLWRRWNLLLGRGRGAAVAAPMRHALLSMACVLLVAILWRGPSMGLLLWLGLHLGLLGLESLRGGRSLFFPLPAPLRAVLALFVLVVSNVLLITPGLAEGVEALRLMFTDRPPTVYSLILENRMTTPWLQTLVALAFVASVALPPLAWVFQHTRKPWRLAGLLLGAVALVIPLRNWPGPGLPDPVRHLAQWPVTYFWGEGNHQVYVGREGWLFPQRELDRLTQVRETPGAEAGLLRLAGALKAQGVPLLLVPVPAKAALYTDRLYNARYTAPVHPPGHAATLERLRAAGIQILDPAPAIWDELYRKEAGFPQDSHWNPDTMKAVAAMTAGLIRKNWPPLYSTKTPEIGVGVTVLDRTDAGDLARALDPLVPESLFGVESVHLVSIPGLESTPASPVLLLGGSDMAVYDDPDLSFGNTEGLPQHAGYATQLAALLGQALDTQVIPDDGAAAGAFLGGMTERALTKKLVVCLIRSDEL